MLTVSGKRRSMYLCSSDVLPTFMSPKSTIFPSGFLIFPQEPPPFPVPSAPCARGAAGAARLPEKAQTRNSRRLGLAGTPNSWRPSGLDAWERGRGSACPRWEGAGDPARRPLKVSRPRRSAPGRGRPGPAPPRLQAPPQTPPTQPPEARARPRPAPVDLALWSEGAFCLETLGRFGQVGAPAPGGSSENGDGVPGGGPRLDASQGRGPGLLTLEPRVPAGMGLQLPPPPQASLWAGRAEFSRRERMWDTTLRLSRTRKERGLLASFCFVHLGKKLFSET